MFNSLRFVSSQKPTARVIGLFSDRRPDKSAKQLDSDGAISAAIARPECTGEPGRIVEAFPSAKGGPARILIVGLGKREDFKPGSLRSIGGQIGRRLALTRDERVEIDLAPALSEAKRIDVKHAGRCLGEGLGLIAWQNWKFKGSAPTNGAEKPKRTALSVSSSDKRFAEGLDRGLALAVSANLCRDLSETPPNIATPAWIADQARALARKTGLRCTVLSGKDLQREKLTGLINVGKASINKPCLIRLEWPGSPTLRGGRSSRSSSKPIVLVGKTMTYDTGGLSLKVNNSMVGMKRDKDGGCAVLGAMHAVATTLKPRTPVVALLAVAENSISDEAYRPDDVLTYRNGVTVEVTNTDAEGRLVLADGLIWACEKENPAAVIDLATLTGGVVTALGSTFAGLFCENEPLRTRLQRAMDSSGERWWRLPMDAEYRDMMKSPIADILNSNPNRKAHPIQGAAFLSFFVTPKTPWAHIDIAGVHAAEADNGCFVKGPTGWGVRLLADLIAG